jgi:hypothetical protein
MILRNDAEPDTPPQPHPVMRECDPVEQNRRSEFLRFLYINDGRQRPEHPMHGLFTGLYVEYQERQRKLNEEPAP